MFCVVSPDPSVVVVDNVSDVSFAKVSVVVFEATGDSVVFWVQLLESVSLAVGASVVSWENPSAVVFIVVDNFVVFWGKAVDADFAVVDN